ncbi:uncharacterized protein LOC119377176, partial [Rhipicephalus sanguineus]|uniref:uncharacterized protein LOC119377176 n=1 Tax=Rhipicephalus sanguineus TaxID=34632 RepID=UPI0020C2FB6E
MPRKVSTAILLILVAHMEVPECFFSAIHVHCYRIRDFVHTKEPIWAYNTTKINDVRCRYDEMRLMEQTFIAFNRTLLHGGRRITVDLRGQFSRSRSARMYVFRGGQPISIETLVYKTRDCSCGVIVVRPVIH